MSQPPLVIRAALSSYIALSGIWFVLTAFYMYLTLQHPDSNIWEGVRWFLVDADHPDRRHRHHEAGLDGSWIFSGEVPRLRVVRKSAEPALIVNAKVFARQDLRAIESAFHELLS